MLTWESYDRSQELANGLGSAGFVFVYGTLKRGGRLHEMLLEGVGTRYEGDDRVTGFTLRVHNGGGFPAAVPAAGAEITGEVYALDECTLAVLDRIEGADRPEGSRMYRREEITTVAGRRVWVYVWDAPLEYLAKCWTGSTWENETRRVMP